MLSCRHRAGREGGQEASLTLLLFREDGDGFLGGTRDPGRRGGDRGSLRAGTSAEAERSLPAGRPHTASTNQTGGHLQGGRRPCLGGDAGCSLESRRQNSSWGPISRTRAGAPHCTHVAVFPVVSTGEQSTRLLMGFSNDARLLQAAGSCALLSMSLRARTCC